VNTPRRVRWARHIVRIREKRNTCSILIGKLERKKKRRGSRRLTEQGRIKMYLQGIRQKDVDSIKLAKNRDK
jgi:hypothetical protein